MTLADFVRLEHRLAAAAATHGAFADDSHALGALHRELYELTEAMQQRDPERVREELLDVATVALRRALEIDTTTNQ